MLSMNMVLSLIATIISSIALIGVAVGLVLQARQLRANQLQTMRTFQLELIKIGIERPNIHYPIARADRGTGDSSRDGYLNLWMKYLELGYYFGGVSSVSASLQAAYFFESEFSRKWWKTLARDVYRVEATTKRQKEFLAIVDAEFQKATCALNPLMIQVNSDKMTG